MTRSVIFYCTLLLLSACSKDKPHRPVTHFTGPISVESEINFLFRPGLLPLYRPGIVEQISSYDTTGGNNDGFSGQFSYIRKENGKLLIADLEGPGVIHRIWTPTPTYDTIQFYMDGDVNPVINIPFMDLFSGKVFPFLNPVVGNEVGGYYCYLPIPFKKSCKIYYGGPAILFHQFQYRIFPDTTRVESFPLSWSDHQKKTLEKCINYWKMDNPNLLSINKDTVPGDKEFNTHLQLHPGEEKVIFQSAKGGRITGIEIGPAGVFAGNHRDLILEAFWDDEKIPAINCPVADFFGYAFGEPGMQGILAGTRSGKNYCYIPMPYDKKAEIRLKYLKREDRQEPIQINTNITYTPSPRDSRAEGKLYVNRNRENPVENGQPFTFLSTQGKGHYVGSILLAQGLISGMTRFFEGDDSTVVDGVMRLHGTGSEDYFNGGWYALPDRWDRKFSLPLHGCLDYSIPYSRTGGYRFYLSDKISFNESLLHTIEHGPEGNTYPADYTSVAFYYSDQPPIKIVDPGISHTLLYQPDTFKLTPDLLKITVGLGAKWERPGWTEVVFSGKEEGILRLDLEELPPGRFTVLLTYFSNPEGPEFSLWQRQQQRSQIFSAVSANEMLNRDILLGEIILNEFYQSITFLKESSTGITRLKIREITLIKKH